MLRSPLSRKTGIKPRLPKCPHCRKRLDRLGQKLHDGCIDGWAEKAAERVEREKEKKRLAEAKAERAADRAKLNSFKKLPKLIAEAQEAFNEYVRWRDKDKGCFVCKRPFAPIPGRVQHAGHVRTRGAAGHLRFVEDNCMGECEGCNDPKWGAKPHQIKAGAIERIGAERFAQLENDNEPHKWQRDELIGIKAEYRAKLKALKAQKEEA